MGRDHCPSQYALSHTNLIDNIQPWEWKNSKIFVVPLNGTLTHPWLPRFSSSSARSALASPCPPVPTRSLQEWSVHWDAQKDIQPIRTLFTRVFKNACNYHNRIQVLHHSNLMYLSAGVKNPVSSGFSSSLSSSSSSSDDSSSEGSSSPHGLWSTSSSSTLAYLSTKTHKPPLRKTHLVSCVDS